MEQGKIRVWFDREGDFVEVMFNLTKPGYFRETADHRVMERVDEQGNLLGFSIMSVSSLRSPAAFDLAAPSTADGD